MAKPNLLQEIKERMKTVNVFEAVGMRLFYLDNAMSRNKAWNKRMIGYTNKIEKIGEKRFGKDWWK